MNPFARTSSDESQVTRSFTWKFSSKSTDCGGCSVQSIRTEGTTVREHSFMPFSRPSSAASRTVQGVTRWTSGAVHIVEGAVVLVKDPWQVSVHSIVFPARALLSKVICWPDWTSWLGPGQPEKSSL